MKASHELLKNEQLVEMFLKLPHKILHHHEVDGLAHIVLHDIAMNLGLRRASYFIDNPDFSCLKGVAGFCKNESKVKQNDLWQDPHSAAKNIDQTMFHTSIKKFLDENVKREAGMCQIDELCKLGKVLGIANPQVQTWNMRHGNMGVLIYEEDDNGLCKKIPDALKQATALLGLCPL